MPGQRGLITTSMWNGTSEVGEGPDYVFVQWHSRIEANPISILVMRVLDLSSPIQSLL